MGLDVIIGWGITLVGLVVTIVIAIWTVKKSSKRPTVVQALDHFEIGNFKKAFGSKIQLTYDGIEMQAVSRTRIAIWHRSGSHLDSTNFLDSDPLHLDPGDGGRILNYSLITKSREQIGLRVEESGDLALLKFDLLDVSDGGMLEVIHTGNVPVRVSGTLKGVTMHEPIGASLSDSSLEAVREKRWKRIAMLGEKSKLLVAVMIILLSAGLTLFSSASAKLVTLLREPKLVSPTSFDLAQIEGQSRFAAQVDKLGSVEVRDFILVILIMAFGLLLSLLVVRVVVKLTRAIIPKSILAISVLSGSQIEQGEKGLLKNSSSQRV